MKYQISISNPCHQNWNSMYSNSEGKFCENCNKNVTDFTNLSDKEILKKLSKSGVCGRFTQEQINKTYQEVPIYRNKFSRFLLGGFFLTPFFTNNLFSNAFEKAKTDLIPLQSKFQDSNLESKQDSLIFKGTVSDLEKGEILPGASIQFIGTNIGVSADINGNFRIDMKNKIQISEYYNMRIAFIGYESKEFKIYHKDLILNNSIFLKLDASIMGEVMYCSIHRSFFQRLIHKLKVGF